MQSEMKNGNDFYKQIHFSQRCLNNVQKGALAVYFMIMQLKKKYLGDICWTFSRLIDYLTKLSIF